LLVAVTEIVENLNLFIFLNAVIIIF
jgi:hypothetical protein